MIKSEEEREAEKAYHELFGEYPPELAFKAGMSDPEWHDTVMAAIDQGRKIGPSSIKDLSGRVIVPAAAYDGKELDDMIQTVEQGER